MHDDACPSVKEVSSVAGKHPGADDLSIFIAASAGFYKRRERNKSNYEAMFCKMD